MTLPNLNRYIRTPEKLDKESLKTFDELIEKYPFFQTARLLHIKNIQNVTSEINKNILHLTATYVSDRKILYYLLHKLPGSAQSKDSGSVEFQQPAVEKEIKDSLKENISSTINDQLNYYEMAPSAEIELIPGLAIDVRKEYGNGILLDDKIYSLNSATKNIVKGKEFFELSKQSDEIPSEEPIEDKTVRQISSSDLIEFHEDTLASSVEEEPFKKDKSVVQDSLSFTSWLDAIDNQLTPTAENFKGEEQGSIEKDIPEQELSEADTAETDENNGISEDNKTGTAKRNLQGSLIDKFIETNPRIVPRTENIANEDISKASITEHESFFTDTLAQIYIKQGHYAKAIFAYEKLSLKYPEKSAYFAGQISKIKKLINNS
ncbi:MAG: hypothetical protein JXB24_13740 [Bacteroidales bacterium]|nr:hypothetical protein [Bacteroidales bacterium]